VGTQTIQQHRYISPFAAKCISALKLPRGNLILDVPCGQGRHTSWLADSGHIVVAIDIDADRVAETDRISRSQVSCLVADAEADLPFGSGCFDLVLIVHFFSRHLLSEAARVLRPRGVLIFETFGAQGQNWRALPAAGEVGQLLCEDFSPLKIDERLAGPQCNRAVVRAYATKQP
jgi:SAM-dependent methyltransferase